MMTVISDQRSLLYLLVAVTITAPSVALLPFRNISLSWDERVNDLVSRLTLTEIELQMAKGGAGVFGGPAPRILSLGISPYSWNTECLTGDVRVEKATSFPQPIGMAASFSPQLASKVSEAIGVEVRAKFNGYKKTGAAGDYKGASCFSPVVNIMRDPRWGRNQETYGEDPFMTGELAYAFVRGLQGDDPRYVRASAGCKHFDAYAGPENIPSSRYTFDAKVTEVDWRMTFLPAFKKCVEAGTYSIMCSYNSINGIPACANKHLLTDILREEWGFKGYVVSDEGALESLITDHKYVKNYREAAAEAVNAGVNLELSDNKTDSVFMNLKTAVSEKLVNESTMRERVKSLFYTRMRLGEFDPEDKNPYNKLGTGDILTPEHRQLSENAAKSSFVLLKNSDGILPLKNTTYSSIAVVGPMADNAEQMYGFYSVDFDPSRASTPRKGLTNITASLRYASGCGDNACTQYNPNEIKNAVVGTDIVFACLGTGQILESEGNDRKNISLPGKQLDLVKDVVKFAQGKPVILIIFSAGPVNIMWPATHVGVNAILQVFFPAETTGDALRNVLLNKGDFASPAGRLPFTWYLGSYPPFNMTDYGMKGRTYRYIDQDNIQAEVLYPFGYGLSYSNFKYSNLNLPIESSAGTPIQGNVTVINKGPFDADEVIQVYLEWPTLQGIQHPLIQLVHFNRVSLVVGSPIVYNFTIEPRQTAVYHDGGWFVPPGTVIISVGGQQPYQVTTIDSNVLQGSVRLLNH